MELAFQIPKVSRIADSTSKNLSDSAIRIPLHGVKSSTVTLHPLFTSESVKLKAKCGAIPTRENMHKGLININTLPKILSVAQGNTPGGGGTAIYGLYRYVPL